MEAPSLVLTTTVNTQATPAVRRVRHLASALPSCLALILTLLVSGCSLNEVVVEGEFPSPLLDKLPVTLGVYYKPEFREHEFYDEATSRGESDWVVKTGAAQVKMYNTLLEGMFERVVLLNELPRKARVAEVGKQAVDAILVPAVSELQYSIPTHTKINVFEIWMRYRYELYSASGEQLADWTMTAYGKTPTAFLRSAEAAVNLAAVVALRDAGANFAVNFDQVPEVKQWLEDTAARRQGQP
jgi:hypothetical protein